MRKVVLELEDGFNQILSITAIGNVGYGINVSTYAVELHKGCHIKIDKKGNGHQDELPKED